VTNRQYLGGFFLVLNLEIGKRNSSDQPCGAIEDASLGITMEQAAKQYVVCMRDAMRPTREARKGS
jgi:hypothetical protein